MTRARALRDAAARHPDRAAALLYALVLVAWLGPTLWGASVLATTSQLYDLLPWAAQAPPGVPRNGLLSDPAVDFWPWLEYARAHLRAGDLPGWNPYALAGTPFYANAQTSFLSPFSLPAWLLPLHVAYGVMAGLKLWVTAFGGYLLLRRLGTSVAPALLSGIALAGCAYSTVWLSHPHSDVFPLVPWTLLGVELCLVGRRGLGALTVALAAGVALLGGHPGTQVHLGVGAAVWAVARALSSGRPRAEALRGIAAAAVGAVVAVLLGAAAWLPSTLAAQATQAGFLREGERALDLPGIVSLVVPDWWGRPTRTDLGGPFNYNERTVYAGVVVLLLAPLGALLGRRRRDRPWVAPLVLVVLGFGAAYGAPLLGWINGEVPPLSLVGGSRVMLLGQVGLVVLAGLGAQALLEAARAGTLPAAGRLVPAAGATALLVLLAGLALEGGQPATRTVAVAAAAGFAWLLVAVLAAFARPGHRTALAVGLVVLVAADLGTFARGYQPHVPRDVAFPAATPALRALQAQTRLRMVALSPRRAVLPDSAMAYGLRSAMGHDPPEPDPAYASLLLAAGISYQGTDFPAATPRTDRILDLLGVDHVYLEPGAAVPAGWRATYTGPDGTVAENPGARNRAFVPREVQVSESDLGRAILVVGSATPAAQTAVLAPGGPPAGAGTVGALRDAGDDVTFRADMTRGGLVVLADRMADGWSVEVDGRPARALTVDRALRGVAVPAGRHEVRWSYRVPGLRLGVVLSVLGLLALAALATTVGLSRRSPRRAA